ncbi:MAG: FMN-binding protein [Deltaproteobacteria bacterium]|jgi:major membrane immunogen (membrane-anchored lipoprotein)|nr:FMN-binding protein [Deltaproteobacteria bacterium]
MTTISKDSKGAIKQRGWASIPKVTLFCLLGVIIISFVASSCTKKSNKLADGYYTAESMAYDEDGWKDYLTIYVNNGQITIAEYDARNMSGFRRSWDMDYMYAWHSIIGTRPESIVSSYQNSLITLQDPYKIQSKPGARNMHANFVSLAQSALEQAKMGNAAVAFVRLPPKQYPDDL